MANLLFINVVLTPLSELFISLDCEFPNFAIMSSEAVLYIGNLSIRTSEEDLREALEGFGVVDVGIYSKLSNGASLGWGRLVFKNKSELNDAKFVLSETLINSRVPVLSDVAPDLGEVLDPSERILSESSHDCLGLGSVSDDRTRYFRAKII